MYVAAKEMTASPRQGGGRSEFRPEFRKVRS